MKAIKPNLQGVSKFPRSCNTNGASAAASALRTRSIVGSGHNSTVLHYSENTSTMKAGDVVVIDAAGEYSMYAADITRTLPVNGHFTARQREIYDIVLGAQEAADRRHSNRASRLLAGDSEDSLEQSGEGLHQEPTEKICMASRWTNISFTASDTTLG